MPKRNWPNHPGIGRDITIDGTPVKIVDVKAGPMTGNPSAALNGEPFVLAGTLKLRVKWPGGAETWLPPTDGDAFIAWCEKQDAAKDLTP